jgi:hypothetical protein
VSFATITLCVAYQVFIVYFVIDSVQKLLDIPSYTHTNIRHNTQAYVLCSYYRHFVGGNVNCIYSISVLLWAKSLFHHLVSTHCAHVELLQLSALQYIMYCVFTHF